MANDQYLVGRRQYGRPQAMLWSNNYGTLYNGIYVPDGYEVGADVPVGTSPDLVDQFLILSDHNRSELQFASERIQQRQRMINGSMRSYHIADKLNLSVSWSMLPSRAFNYNPGFDASGDITSPRVFNGSSTDIKEYTADGGAGGVEILDWYETHTGPFWVFLAYDKYTNFGDGVVDSSYTKLNQYSQVMKMYFKDFSYSIVKRGRDNHDMWNISVTLEEE